MKVDFVISCGRACRPAYYAKKLAQRKFSSPCDWMMNYSLHDFIEVLRTEGKHMFRNVKYDQTNKCVYDMDNGMISMHDFHCSQPLDMQLPDFYEKMERRAKNTVKRIAESRRVGVIMDRDVEALELIEFAKSMELMFPECFFQIVNIKDIPYQEVFKTKLVTQTTKYRITEISFNDSHVNGRDKVINPSFWQGNVCIWERVMLNYFHVRGQRLKYYAARIKEFTTLPSKLAPFFRHLGS